MTNKWWEIKKKLWGEEAARAAGEKNRQMATAAGVKRKRDEKAANPVPPKPVKQKLKWYDLPPNTMKTATPPPPPSTTTTTTTTAPADHAAAVASPSAADDASGADGYNDGIAYAAAAADVTRSAAITTTTTNAPTTTAAESEITDQHMHGQSEDQDGAPDDGPTHEHSEMEEHSGHQEDAGVV